MTGPDTRQRAESYVTDCLGEYAPEHDVPAITDELHGLAGSWDVSQVDTDRFWTVAQAHALAGQEGSAPHDGDAPRLWHFCHNRGRSAPHDGDAPAHHPRRRGPAESAPHDGDAPRAQVSHLGHLPSAPHDGDTLPELTAATATAEIAWVAREARALRGSDDERRRARFFARKAALLAYIDQPGQR